MLKWKKTYDAGKKYNKAWEKSYPLLKCAGDNQSGYLKSFLLVQNFKIAFNNKCFI